MHGFENGPFVLLLVATAPVIVCWRHCAFVEGLHRKIVAKTTASQVLGTQARRSNQPMRVGDPDPPWRKEMPLCYSTFQLTKNHVCGPEFKTYKQTATLNTTHLDKVSDDNLREFRVGDRVQAKRDGKWVEGVVQYMHKDDKDNEGRWAIQCDVDFAGKFLFTTELRPTPARVHTLGFLDLGSDDEKYVAELAEESRHKSDKVLGAIMGPIMGPGAKMIGHIAQSAVPLGGFMTELLVSTIQVMIAPAAQKKQKLDLTSVFMKFEARLKLLNFGNVLDEIQRRYGEFSKWLKDLLDPDLAPTKLRYQERVVFMIESHLDAARVLFTQRDSSDPDLEAYYLFEPVLQQAILHQVVMLMHASIYAQLGEHQEAVVHVGRAKRRYDEYRQLLTDMQSKLVTWRELQVKVGGTSILSLINSTWRKGKNMCKENWKNGGGHNHVWDEVEVAYTWEDTFEKKSGTPTLRRSRSFRIIRNHIRNHGTMIAAKYSGDECSWVGVWTDGRDMLQEPEAYAATLRSQLLYYTNSLLDVLDAAWLKLPGEECLDDFALLSLKDCADCHCQVTEDESLPSRLKAHFGPLHEGGTWPGQQPVLVAERYVVCERGRNRDIPVSDGNICVKFV